MPKKPKKRYRTKIIIGYDESGLPLRKWAGGYTKKARDEHAEKIRREHTMPVSEIDRDTLVFVYIQKYYDIYRKSESGESQRANIASAINNHILPYIGDKQIQAVSAMDLQVIANNLKGYGKTIIGDISSILTSTFSHAYANGAIDRDPSVGLVFPKPAPPDEKRALTDAETRAVLDLCTTYKYGLLVLMYYYLGLRRGEGLGGMGEDIDRRRAEYHVERDIDFIVNGVGGLKSEAARRILPIPNELMEIFNRIPILRGTYIVQAPKGGFLPKSTYDRMWDEFRVELLKGCPSIEAKEIGSYRRANQDAENRLAKREKRKPEIVPPVYGSILTAHYLRHNYASILYDAGVDVLTAQKLLGHADPVTTLRIYTHLKESRERISGEVVRAAFVRERGMVFT